MRSFCAEGAEHWSPQNQYNPSAASGELRGYSVTGLLVIREDLDPELARAASQKFRLRGVLVASEAVQAVLADRIG